MKELPYYIYSKICTKLSVRRDLTFDDFRLVAEKLDVEKDTIELIEQQKNPAHSLFKEFCPYVTVLQLRNILHEIELLDVAAILEGWINGTQ